MLKCPAKNSFNDSKEDSVKSFNKKSDHETPDGKKFENEKKTVSGTR